MQPVTPRLALLAGSLILMVCSAAARGETPADMPTLLYEKGASVTAHSGNVDAPRLEDWVRAHQERH